MKWVDRRAEVYLTPDCTLILEVQLHIGGWAAYFDGERVWGKQRFCTTEEQAKEEGKEHVREILKRALRDLDR